MKQKTESNIKMKYSGYVENITFRNEDNGYTVMTISSGKEEMTVVGEFAYIGLGEYIEVDGEEYFHDIYGKQIKATSFKILPPDDESAYRKYLSSGAIKGIGAVLADRIVSKFGKDTFRVIEEEPERLAEIRGITRTKAVDICSQMEDKREARDIMIFLQGYGITPKLSTKIYNLYGDKVYEIIKNNPYRLADEVDGVGFKIADDIAIRGGVKIDASIRIQSGICYALNHASMSGHMYLPKDKLVELAVNILGLRDQYQNPDGTFDMSFLDEVFKELLATKRIIEKEIDGLQAYYLAPFYYTELYIANKLTALDFKDDVDDYIAKVKVNTIEETSKIELDELQRDAVISTAKRGVSIITGGPGTGKTTTINAIIDLFESEGKEVRLAAPTGRAAKRMTEATGHEAKTLHRLLEVNGLESGYSERFGKNEDEPLECDVIIVDEMSMVDTFLFNSFLKAVTVGTKVVLVGDVDQLPSVGPGNVLRDLIESDKFRVSRLTKVFRQNEGSGIVENAHKINKGENFRLDNKTGDFLYIRREETTSVGDAVVGLIMSKLPQYLKVDMMDIQVLTPMRIGVLGVNGLNPKLQQYLNPKDKKKNERQIGDVIFREGDKVMQVKNNYQMAWEIRNNKYVVDSGTGIFNGDMGRITKINNGSNVIEVKFDDDKYVIYDMAAAADLELAYAVTIHKSQGSEYPAVVMPLHSGTNFLMTRNLLYTGVTRAKKCVCIVGLEEMFNKMINNKEQQKRYSGLKWLLTNMEEEE